MSDNKDSTGLLLLGILFGAIIAFVILGRKEQTTSLSNVNQQDLHPEWRLQPPEWKPIDIPRVDDIKLASVSTPVSVNNTDSQFNHVTITSQLEKVSFQLEQTASKLQETMSKLNNPTSQPIQQPQPIIIQPAQMQQPQPIIIQPIQEQTKSSINKIDDHSAKQKDLTQNQCQQTIYKNNEKWEIIRGSDGRIKTLNIIRDVKKSD